MIELEKALEVAKIASLKAQKVVQEFTKNGFKINQKGPSNLVTEADLASEKIIIETIKEHFPNHSFLGEETEKASYLADNLWVIDPIDGTTNFAHGVPHCGISIAYYEKGTPVCGVVLNPFTSEMFSAGKGLGAFLNDIKINVTPTDELVNSLIVTGFNYELTPQVVHGLKAVELLIKEKCHGIRRLGAASLDMCFVACGRFDGYYELRLAPWDFGAGIIIVEEAGGKVTNLEGSRLSLQDTQVICTNLNISDKLRNLVVKAGTNLS